MEKIEGNWGFVEKRKKEKKKGDQKALGFDIMLQGK